MTVKRRGGNQPDDDGGAGKAILIYLMAREVHTVASWECVILVHNDKTALNTYAISGSQICYVKAFRSTKHRTSYFWLPNTLCEDFKART